MDAPSEVHLSDARLHPERYSETQLRTLYTAIDLFADHGVGGTSLQMIANALGVTKAAVYHQFKTKDALVLAAAEVGLAPLQTAMDEAEQAGSREQGREILLARVIDLAISRRRWATAIQYDPAMVRLLGTYEPFVELMNRVYALLLDLDADPSARVRTTIVSAAIAGAISHPLVAGLDDETIRAELVAISRRLFDLPG